MSTYIKGQNYWARGISWVKVSACIVLKFALPPFSSLSPPVVQISKQNRHWTFEPRINSIPVNIFQILRDMTLIKLTDCTRVLHRLSAFAAVSVAEKIFLLLCQNMGWDRERTTDWRSLWLVRRGFIKMENISAKSQENFWSAAFVRGYGRNSGLI